MDKKAVRLQKILAEFGVASRRKAEDLISEGRVKVNGRKAQIGDSVVPSKDRILVDNQEVRISKESKKLYIMLNKPRGYITTLNDEQGRRCVAELVADVGDRVYPVGRLDRESEGMLLLTNDGSFAQTITHPSYHIPKTYFVSSRPQASQEQLTALEKGVVIDDVKTSPAKVNVLADEGDKTLLEITIYEGRNRQIRKMCEAVGLEVARLKRVSIGNQKLGGLKSGKWRELNKREVQLLLEQATKVIN
jgi:23S rRNA pseudouridine2605 synthase